MPNQDKDESDIDKSLSFGQQLMSSFGGYDNQMKNKRQAMKQNDQQAELDAVRKRMAASTTDPK